MFVEEGAPKVPKFTASEPEFKTGLMYGMWKKYIDIAFGM